MKTTIKVTLFAYKLPSIGLCDGHLNNNRLDEVDERRNLITLSDFQVI